MKKKAFLAIILVLALCLSACGDSKKPAKELNKGDIAYQVLDEGQNVANLDNKTADKIILGYEATDGYLAAEIDDPEQIELVTTSFKKITVGDKTDDNSLNYYPARYITFCYGDEELVYYFADTNCYTYDGVKDLLTYYQLENYEEAFAMTDIIIIANNPDIFDESYAIYDDSSCTASIVDYQYDEEKDQFKVVFDLNNESGESRIFKVINLVVNGNAIDSKTVFVIDANDSFQYAAPVELGGITPEEIKEIKFNLYVTNDFENPTYEFTTEEVNILPSEE